MESSSWLHNISQEMRAFQVNLNAKTGAMSIIRADIFVHLLDWYFSISTSLMQKKNVLFIIFRRDEGKCHTALEDKRSTTSSFLSANLQRLAKAQWLPISSEPPGTKALSYM